MSAADTHTMDMSRVSCVRVHALCIVHARARKRGQTKPLMYGGPPWRCSQQTNELAARARKRKLRSRAGLLLLLLMCMQLTNDANRQQNRQSAITSYSERASGGVPQFATRSHKSGRSKKQSILLQARATAPMNEIETRTTQTLTGFQIQSNSSKCDVVAAAAAAAAKYNSKASNFLHDAAAHFARTAFLFFFHASL